MVITQAIIWWNCCVQRFEKSELKNGSLTLLKNGNVRKLLDDILTWKFDIIALEKICMLQYINLVQYLII